MRSSARSSSRRARFRSQRFAASWESPALLLTTTAERNNDASSRADAYGRDPPKAASTKNSIPNMSQSVVRGGARVIVASCSWAVEGVGLLWWFEDTSGPKPGDAILMLETRTMMALANAADEDGINDPNVAAWTRKDAP